MTGPGLDSQALVGVLRRATGSTALALAAPPAPVSGGYWAQIYSVRLLGAPPELDRDLILRIMPEEFVANRERLVQEEVVRQGFPAPPIRLAGGRDDGLGGPWVLMDRAPGSPPLPDLDRRVAPAALARTALELPGVLARISARLHALDPAPLQAALASTPGNIVGPMDFLAQLEARATAASAARPDLAAAAVWLRAHPPPAGRLAICHGDLHPFNLLVDGDRVSLIDWSVAMIADPAFDLAFTSMMLALAPLDLPPALVRPVRAMARGLSRRFLRRYRRLSPDAAASLAADVLGWHTAVHCLRALVEAAEWVAAGAANERTGHPWLTLSPQLAARLSAVTGLPCRA